MVGSGGAAPTRWLDDKQQHQWRAYVVGTTLLLDRLDRELRRSHGISLDEYEILVRLSEAPKHTLRMAILADSLCHSRSRTTHTVSRMENAGLIVRQPSSEDGRGVEAVMTRHGHDRLVAAAPAHVDGVRRHLVDHADREELGAIGAVFDRVVDELMTGHVAETDIRSGR